MCNACGFLCCGSDEFAECGCNHCPHPECHWDPCGCGVANCRGCDDPDCDLDEDEIEGMRAHAAALKATAS